MIWVWNFILYSFFGFLLEVAYAGQLEGGGTEKACLCSRCARCTAWGPA